jgi:hypothetical protein
MAKGTPAEEFDMVQTPGTFERRYVWKSGWKQKDENARLKREGWAFA